MTARAAAVAALAATTAAAGYAAGRSRPLDRLDHRVRWRMAFGPGEGRRPVGWLDYTAYAMLHPLDVAQALARTPRWSPFYRPPEPVRRVSIDAIGLMPRRDDTATTGETA